MRTETDRNTRKRRALRAPALLLTLAAVLAAGLAPAAAQEPDGENDGNGGQDVYAAEKLLQRAEDLLLAGEDERGVKMLETVVQQYPAADVRFKAQLALGKHFRSRHQYDKAISYLRNLREMEPGEDEEPLKGDRRELYLEGMYLTGVCYFRSRQYGMAFPVLRKITREYPNTVWANQSYYYIGLCHFAQENWSKAIEALGFVGTFVDPDSPTVQYVEAGRRFYVKVNDADLPILHRLGRKALVAVETERGDKEQVECIPLSEGDGLFIGSIPTEIAEPDPGDNTVQVVGGDVLTARYVDANTEEGKPRVPRESRVKVVSTGSLTFTLGTFESQAPAGFLGEPLFVLLEDTDLDAGPAADEVTVRVIARYKDDEQVTGEESSGVDIEKLMAEEEETWKVRDEVILKLTELGAKPVHSGRFGGKVRLAALSKDESPDKTDDVLSCLLDDEVVATYVDELHIGGESPRQANAKVKVVGEIDSHPRATQNVVNDPVIQARKGLVEATAYLELGRIFKSMGLMDGARGKCSQGLALVNDIIATETPIPETLREEAFKLKWELFIVQEAYGQAIATCRVFSRLYPNSPFVDEALIGIARIHFDNEAYDQAVNVCREVLRLEKSQVKAEAQFTIARAVEEKAKQNAKENREKFEFSEAAIREYKQCAERYPDSKFAGESLAKLVDYYIATKDYAQADTMLDQVFQDYPDAEFLDRMLLKWVLVSYYMRDYEKAQAKCSQLIFEYPASQYAETAKKVLPQIEAQLSKAG